MDELAERLVSCFNHVNASEFGGLLPETLSFLKMEQIPRRDIRSGTHFCVFKVTLGYVNTGWNHLFNGKTYQRVIPQMFPLIEFPKPSSKIEYELHEFEMKPLNSPKQLHDQAVKVFRYNENTFHFEEASDKPEIR